MSVSVRQDEQTGDIIVDHDPNIRIDTVLALLQLASFKISANYFGAVLQTSNAREKGSPAEYIAEERQEDL